MTKPVNVKNMAQFKRLERNVTGSSAPRAKRRTAPRRVTMHVADDVKPETLAALAQLAMRVMEMGEDELREFLKKVRRK